LPTPPIYSNHRSGPQIDKERAGVVVGSGNGGATTFSAGVEDFVRKGPRGVSPCTIPFAMPNAASALVSIDARIGFLGPNYSISTACATSNHCLHSTADQIRLGRSDVMGGAEAAVAPVCLDGFAALRALSRRNGDPGAASRPWDRDRDGFVLGEGTGTCAPSPRSRGNVCVRLCSPLLFVVRCVRLLPRCKLMTSHGRRRGAPILAEYLGGAASCDAHHLMDPRPDGHGAAACIRRSLEDAGVAPEEVWCLPKCLAHCIGVNGLVSCVVIHPLRI